MRILFAILVFALLFLACPPLFVAVLFVLPVLALILVVIGFLLWLLWLPFRVAALLVNAAFSTLRAILLLPSRLLGA